MDNIGKVIKTRDIMAQIEIKRASACGEKCGSCKGGCNSTGIYIDIENTLQATPGQFVKIEIETKSIMKVAFLVYLFPLIMLILGIFSGSFLYDTLDLTFSSDLFNFFIGILFMAIACIIIRIIDSIYKSKGKLQYKMVKIL